MINYFNKLFKKKYKYEKYEIIEVINLDTNKRDETYSYRIGRKCDLDNVKIGKHLHIHYSDDRVCVTSKIHDIFKTKHFVSISTENREYRFIQIS